MPLLYSCVAWGQTILAHWNPYHGSFESVAADCLKHLSKPEPKFSVEHNSSTFNFIHQKGYTYLVVSDEHTGRSLAFGCLEAIRAEWEAKYINHWRTAEAHCLDSVFGPRLKAHMEYCNAHPEEFNKLVAMQQMVGEVTSRMQENVVLVLERGQIIDGIQDKATALEEESRIFQSRSKKLRCHMCVQYYKMWAVAALLLCVLVVVIFLAACFSNGNNCTKH